MAKLTWAMTALTLFSSLPVSAGPSKNTYIVGKRAYPNDDGPVLQSFVHDSMDAISADSDDLLYIYEHAFTGYAARLTDDQVEALRNLPDILSVAPDQEYTIDTTRTAHFLGIEDTMSLMGQLDGNSSAHPDSLDGLDVAEADSNIIIGIIDTGEQWTVENCNKKLIGARYFDKGFAAASGITSDSYALWQDTKSARDNHGHGTHVSSTAAGSEVAGAGFFGQATGTARGMAKNARLAMYKMCFGGGKCLISDYIAAMDKAIEDGVNIISCSFSGHSMFELTSMSATAVGGWRAMERGVFMTASAGNYGPRLASMTNQAPWLLTVAASTLDRDYPAYITLGNGNSYEGVSFHTNGDIDDVATVGDDETIPFIAGSSVGSINCLPGQLDPELVSGKVIFCTTRGVATKKDRADEVKNAGGRGVVFLGNLAQSQPDIFGLPVLDIDSDHGGDEVFEYAKGENATVNMQFHGSRIGIPAPQMAVFSSRGPAGRVPQLLKPDITGPGFNILAGLPPPRDPENEYNK
ncbi:Subtilisin-like protease SBT1.7 [Colletotrichum orbiculare MAFF 240422]|uniref:Subtilisin-like protease SBT1.7 n=2 Tax=Colletotrichum orbiculare species complex TaxID=2707354 RepID=N4US97_COLOR|nr:Subtilisin-like protease SBT1.7 [Colletotrichum orbiculare MAFF 240422]